MAERVGDRVLAICVIAAALIYLYADSRLPKLRIGDPLGPKVFPAIVGIGLLGSGLLLLLETRNKGAVAAEEAHADPQARLHGIVLVLMTVWTVLYYKAFEPVGYLISTLVYTFALLAYFNRGRWVMNTLVSVGFTLSAYAIFVKFLGVSMPGGIFAF